MPVLDPREPVQPRVGLFEELVVAVGVGRRSGGVGQLFLRAGGGAFFVLPGWCRRGGGVGADAAGADCTGGGLKRHAGGRMRLL